MTTPADLRHTLSSHAGEVADRPAVERLAAVHGRVRVVRRRRRASVALMALAAVVGVGVVAWLPGSDGPEPARRPSIGGVTAPKTMTSLGYGYSFDSAVAGSNAARLDLDAVDQPRLVSWAGASGVVDLRSDLDLDGDGEGPDVTTPGTADFSDFRYVPAGLAQTIRVTGEGEVALAVYDLATRAPGVTEQGVTWRTEVGDARLLSAGTGEVGRPAFAVSATLPASGSVSVSASCTGAPPDTEVQVEVGGVARSWGGCADGAPQWDGATASGSRDSFDVADAGIPGGAVTVRVSLVASGSWTDGRLGTPVTSAPDAQLGVGIYVDGPAGGRVGTRSVPAQLEQDGHLWRLKEVLAGRAGRSTLRADLGADATPVLVQTVTDHTLAGYTRTSIGGEEVATSGDGGDGLGSTQSVATLVNQSVSGEVRVTRAGPETVLGLVVYEQAD